MDEKIEYKSRYFSYIERLTAPQKPNSEDEIHAHHDGAEIYEFLVGDLYFSADGERMEIEAGDIVILTDGVLHRPIVKTECTYHRRRVSIANRFFIEHSEGGMELKKRLDERRAFKISKENDARSECSLLLDEIKELLSHSDTYSAFCATNTLITLLIKALDTKVDTSPSPRKSGREKASALIRYIDENIKEELSYKKLADMLHISPKNLYKLFKRETGFTLSRYIKERRIIIAKSLLNSGSSPFEAAEKTGFCDYSTFYRAFRASVGVSPSAYNRQE